MASVYILISKRLDKYYSGSCHDLKQRLSDHENKTYGDSLTALASDWELYFEVSNLQGDTARKIEQHEVQKIY